MEAMTRLCDRRWSRCWADSPPNTGAQTLRAMSQSGLQNGGHLPGTRGWRSAFPLLTDAIALAHHRTGRRRRPEGHICHIAPDDRAANEYLRYQ